MKWCVSFLVFCAVLIGCGGSAVQTSQSEPQDDSGDVAIGSSEPDSSNSSSSSSGGVTPTESSTPGDQDATDAANEAHAVMDGGTDALKTEDAGSNDGGPGADSGKDGGPLDTGIPDVIQDVVIQDAIQDTAQPHDTGTQDAVADVMTDGGDAEAGPGPCTPGTTQCSGVYIQMCNNNGTWSSPASCDAVASPTDQCKIGGTCVNGSCSYSSTTNATDGTECAYITSTWQNTGSGTCYSGSCCFGCWNSATNSCMAGNSLGACGQMGKACVQCGDNCLPTPGVTSCSSPVPPGTTTCCSNGLGGGYTHVGQLTSCYSMTCSAGACLGGPAPGSMLHCGNNGTGSMTCHTSASVSICEN